MVLIEDREEFHVCLILSALKAGGAERVMSELANYIARKEGFRVTLILLTKDKRFYEIDSRVTILEPTAPFRADARLKSTIQSFVFLRKQLKLIRPNSTLSFGGKFNAFVLIAGIGLSLRMFISDRSRPTISYGRFLDFLNPKVYRLAAGIISQTEVAKSIMYESTKHERIRVIGNPIHNPGIVTKKRSKIILNVGRFIKSKHQDWLVDYFDNLDEKDWELVFLGDGPELDRVKNYALTKASSTRIRFEGSVKNIKEYYALATIFAFTSSSEGYPNSLGEAMSFGLACVSFDCLAGPADLIEDQVNGFLVEVGNHKVFTQRLNQLIKSNSIRKYFGEKARLRALGNNIDEIGAKYLEFISS